MKFPGYVTLFKDKNNYIHLYFFPGVTDENEYYYNKLDLSDCKIKYTQNLNSDNSIEYIFENKRIIKINCKLISINGDVIYKTFNIK